jgi:hypothetical protein
MWNRWIVIHKYSQMICVLLYIVRWQYWHIWLIHIWSVNNKFDVITELLSMKAMKNTTIGKALNMPDKNLGLYKRMQATSNVF